MIDEVLDQAQDGDSFALLALGLLSATTELERLWSPGAARSGRSSDVAVARGRGEPPTAPAVVTADDPCLLAVLGLLGFARRFREVLEVVEDVPGVVETPRADDAPPSARGSLLR